MNKDEMKMIEDMIKDIPKNIIAYDGNPKGQYLYAEQRKEIAQVLCNANYRKVADNEMIFNAYQLHDEFKKHRQETAREILKWMDEPFTDEEIRKLITEKYGIE